MAEDAVARFGRPDLLFANAGTATRHDARDGMVRQPHVAGAIAFPQRPEHRPLGDLRRVQPGTEV